MAISTVVTSGFGNGTVAGTVALIVTRGYSIGVEAVAAIWLAQATLISPTPSQATLINEVPTQQILINAAPAQKILNADGDT